MAKWIWERNTIAKAAAAQPSLFRWPDGKVVSESRLLMGRTGKASFKILFRDTKNGGAYDACFERERAKIQMNEIRPSNFPMLA